MAVVVVVLVLVLVLVLFDYVIIAVFCLCPLSYLAVPCLIVSWCSEADVMLLGRSEQDDFKPFQYSEAASKAVGVDIQHYVATDEGDTVAKVGLPSFVYVIFFKSLLSFPVLLLVLPLVSSCFALPVRSCLALYYLISYCAFSLSVVFAAKVGGKRKKKGGRKAKGSSADGSKKVKMTALNNPFLR